jgi:hypothetical protein
MFNYCTAITKVITDNPNLTRLEKGVFNHNEALVEFGSLSATNCDIPSYITYFGDYAFNHNSSLIVLSVPATVTSMGKYSFANCLNLQEATI